MFSNSARRRRIPVQAGVGKSDDVPGCIGGRMSPAGYCHRAYAASFAEFGVPYRLRHSDSWLLARVIPGSENHDAMGCYPLFCCGDWSGLAADMENAAHHLVSVVLVTDPFGTFCPSDLAGAFDSVIPWKQHFVTELDRYPPEIQHPRTRRNLRKALESIEVEVCAHPTDRLEEWNELYQQLCLRRRITGLRAFSPATFRAMLKVPGLVMFRAAIKDETVGLHLWMQQDNVAHGHLGATNELGYRHMASYALYWFAIEHFRHKVEFLGLGAAPGNGEHRDDGLLKFKRPWATATRTTYFCTRILNQDKYNSLVAATATTGSQHFPAYRQGEFA
jgi:hypothetical protein